MRRFKSELEGDWCRSFAVILKGLSIIKPWKKSEGVGGVIKD